MTSIQSPPEQQQVIYQEIADALFLSTDEEWPEIRMLISSDSPQEPRIEISGPDHTPSLRIPHDDLFVAVGKLISLFNETGRVFKQADYRLIWIESTEEWKMSVDYKW